ncbi:hypothetical protein evm_014782 [Chilo suppressalis]|nr:hypothetical protein evm_014782 [Chilo suppressalis]
MATEIITISLSLLVIATDVQTQYFDLFQGYQPFVPLQHTTKRPDFLIYPQENSQKRSKGEAGFISNDRQTSKEQTRRQPSHSHERDGNKHTTKRKHVTTASLFNLNFFTTPAPIKRAIKNSSRRHFNTDESNINDNISTSQEQTNKRAYNSNFDDKRQSYDETLNNIAENYHSTTKRAYSTTRRNYITPKPNRATTKSAFATTKNYHSTRRPGSDVNSYYTTLRPGVRPANVDLSKPPITNKPPALAVYPRPTDSSVIRFPEDPDTSPELIPGPDEDKMSYAEKRRYIELAEKMCDKYKSLNVKKLEAIPLVPSPEPVRVNVSVCPPTNVPLVVGGKVVTIQEFPHMTLLGWTKLQGGGYSWKCGGSLISDQYVLTASHCAHQDKDDTVVTGAPRVVQLGSSYLDDAGALVVKVLSVFRHPKYISNRSYYDIALVKLVKPVT